MDSIKAANLTADRPFRFQKNYKPGIVNAKPGGLVKPMIPKKKMTKGFGVVIIDFD